MENHYETKQQLSERLGVSSRTINIWMAQRRIPFCRLSERVVRFIPGDVDAALERFTVKAHQVKAA
jgi:excisionase family DNA binding protein